MHPAHSRKAQDNQKLQQRKRVKFDPPKPWLNLPSDLDFSAQSSLSSLSESESESNFISSSALNDNDWWNDSDSSLTSLSDSDLNSSLGSDARDLDDNSHSVLPEEQSTSSPVKTEFQIKVIEQQHKELLDAIAEASAYSKAHPKSITVAIKESERLGLIREFNNIRQRLNLINPKPCAMQASFDTVASYRDRQENPPEDETGKRLAARIRSDAAHIIKERRLQML